MDIKLSEGGSLKVLDHNGGSLLNVADGQPGIIAFDGELTLTNDTISEADAKNLWNHIREVRKSEMYKLVGERNHDILHCSYIAGPGLVALTAYGRGSLTDMLLSSEPTSSISLTSGGGNKSFLFKYNSDNAMWDTTPTLGSTKPVTSGGIFDALAGKIAFDGEVTLNFAPYPTIPDLPDGIYKNTTGGVLIIKTQGGPYKDFAVYTYSEVYHATSVQLPHACTSSDRHSLGDIGKGTKLYKHSIRLTSAPGKILTFYSKSSTAFSSWEGISQEFRYGSDAFNFKVGGEGPNVGFNRVVDISYQGTTFIIAGYEPGNITTTSTFSQQYGAVTPVDNVTLL